MNRLRAPRRAAVDVNVTGRRLAILSLTALGVVYGDIGTSPLYALRVCFSPAYGGVLSHHFTGNRIRRSRWARAARAAGPSG